MKLGVIVLFLGATPAAGQLAWLDAESDPAVSNWHVNNPVQLSVNRLPEAAHRGLKGIRFVQPPGTVPEGSTYFFEYELSPSGSNYYLRTWLRFSSFTAPMPGAASLTLARITHRFGAERANGAVLTIFPSGGGFGVSVQGSGARYTDGGVPSIGRKACGTLDTKWHLLELEFSGRGGAGRVACAIDREGPVPTEFPTFASSGFGAIQFGGPTSFGSIGVEFDFDDLGGDSSPLPSGLVLSAPESLSNLECVPVEVSLTSTFAADSGVRAPYRMELSLAGADSFRDEGCRDPGPPILEKGSERTMAYARVVDAGLTQLVVSHPDLFSGATTVTVNERPGSSDSLYSLTSCAGVPVPLVMLLIVWSSRGRKCKSMI